MWFDIKLNIRLWPIIQTSSIISSISCSRAMHTTIRYLIDRQHFTLLITLLLACYDKQWYDADWSFSSINQEYTYNIASMTIKSISKLAFFTKAILGYFCGKARENSRDVETISDVFNWIASLSKPLPQKTLWKRLIMKCDFVIQIYISPISKNWSNTLCLRIEKQSSYEVHFNCVNLDNLGIN